MEPAIAAPRAVEMHVYCQIIEADLRQGKSKKSLKIQPMGPICGSGAVMRNWKCGSSSGIQICNRESRNSEPIHICNRPAAAILRSGSRTGK
jgi:hypothetical protein